METPVSCFISVCKPNCVSRKHDLVAIVWRIFQQETVCQLSIHARIAYQRCVSVGIYTAHQSSIGLVLQYRIHPCSNKQYHFVFQHWLHIRMHPGSCNVYHKSNAKECVLHLCQPDSKSHSVSTYMYRKNKLTVYFSQ